ncbi:hypothetical protein ON010_g392 [Phytophthora cinnamomi]|nr:hypothetical protein ON010_g392 [Phytophthora cinnamomi]
MRFIFSTFVELWESTQVELHGRYSEERTLELAKYATKIHWTRVLAVLLATPLPCLAVTILIDVLPLADPSEGLRTNAMFLAREYYSYLVMNFLSVQQFRTSVRALSYPMKRVIVNSIFMSALCLGFYYVCALLIGFPVPFSIVDIVLLGLSLRDVEVARQGLEELELRVEQESGWVGHNDDNQSSATLERVSRLLQHKRVDVAASSSLVGTSSTISIGPGLIALAQSRQKQPNTVKKSLVIMARDACSTFALAPHPLRAAKQLLGNGSVHPVMGGIDVVPNGAPKFFVKLSYTRKVRRLLYMAEFVLLLNYVDVIVPLVFSIYLAVMYELPNRRYYAQLEGMQKDLLYLTLKNVLFYCSLQLISLILLIIALQRKLGLSPIRQLAFVLEKQFAGLQIKLIFWVFYNVQASLKHAGYDYSFHFVWLRGGHNVTRNNKSD